MKHKKFPEIFTLVKANEPVLLHGEKGTGKTTIFIQVAEELGLTFHSLSMTRQTTLSHILGFRSVTGDYISTVFRKAVEEGGLFLLDELDAADPNVILSLNTLENGFVSFPDGIVKVHKDFRLVATANPFDDHSHYTGRATLDAATLDRFDKILLELDDDLEATLVSEQTLTEIRTARWVVEQVNIDIRLSTRDALRLEKRKQLGLAKDYIYKTLLKGDNVAIKEYKKHKPEKILLQEDCKTVSELWKTLKKRKKQND